MTDPFSVHLAAFIDCYQRYAPQAQGNAWNMALKRDHCLRVLDEARLITASLGPGDGLDPELERLIHVAALFHDVGRFPQLVRWGTFNDRKSANHGALGVRAMRDCGLLEGLGPQQARLVRVAVAMHNRRDIPSGLPRAMDLALRVLRDADKLDIMPVLLAHFRAGAGNDVVMLGLVRDDAAYTPALLEQLRQGRIADYERMRFVNDFKLLLLSWVYDMNFAVSRRAFWERGYLRELIDALPDLPPFEGLFHKLRGFLGQDQD